ncbi:hypothetical protein RND71_008164 [Anisodus tanguticus]|uniref:Uncharacterized protein n=1 Tax=Anisodus tanguticus TaxID=243964 RepID=A0AAE1SMQ7_9SOLA|nr:hypothetical protein RND71_008164 [Anisodus tanguticus]
MEAVNPDVVEAVNIPDNDDVVKPLQTQSVILDRKNPFETPIDVPVRSDSVKQFKKWVKDWKTNKKDCGAFTAVFAEYLIMDKSIPK